MKNTLSVLFLFFLMVCSAPAFAQNGTCNVNTIEISTDSYEIGDFASVKRNLELCVQNQSFGNSLELNKARELLALTAIVEDRLDDAKLYIEQIVSSNINFVSSYRNIVFDDIFDAVKRENVGVTVSSVSKKAEDLNTAPATVKLVTQDEIKDRGYKDLIDLLSDLPGFDISKTFSVTYANIYQMGFRQENSERTLFMVDGIEENDLWLNWAYISRQYPLSNIKAVEILYGPSSTMYGPRAFIGTINVITYSPKEVPEDHLLKGKNSKTKPKSFYAHGQSQVGDFNTYSSDLTMGLRGKAAALQVSGSIYRSDEHNLSSTEFYNYSSDDINNLIYTKMNLSGKAGVYSFEDYMKKFSLPATHPYYTVNKNATTGLITSMNLTTAGINQARRLDSTAYAGRVNGAPIGYSNHSNDYFFSAKLTVDNFLLGVRHWKTTEGFGFYQDIDVAGSRNGSVWSPENTTVYAQYDRQVNEKISISNLSNFALHRLGKESNRVNFIAFGDPRANLHLAHLVNPTELIPSIKTELRDKDQYGSEIVESLSYSMMKNGWRNRYYYYEAQQFRNETRLFYEGEKLKLSSGIDLRSTLTQGDYLIYMDYNSNFPDTKAYKDKQAEVSLAREKGIVLDQAEGSNMFSIIDVGVFTQVTYNFGDKIFLSGGNRIDYNRIRRSGGYGLVFSPRLSAIYNTEFTTFKFNYSRGLQNVSQFTKYSTGGGRVPNTELETESINFINLEYLGHFGNGSLGWEVNAFGYIIDGAVASGVINGVRKNYNAGEYRNVGLMSGFYYKPKSKDWNIQLNHTYFKPEQISSTFVELTDPVRLGDIASHRINLSITKQTHIGPISNVLNLRANYVSERPIGVGTTQPTNPGVGDTGIIPAYLLLNGNIGFKIQSLPMLRLDLSVENILNKNILDNNNPEYYHPGPREASGSFNLPSDVPGRSYGDRNIPYFTQRPRFLMLRLSFSI
jgi:outer membrane receptor for ferrienterochelin and colicin